MATRDEAVEIPVDGRGIPGIVVAPAAAIPGMLFVQGWGSRQDVYLPRARQIAALGCVGHLVAWIRQEPSRIRHLRRLANSKLSSVFSGLVYPCNKVGGGPIRIGRAARAAGAPTHAKKK